MKRESQGRYVTISTAGEKAQAFVPSPLPPRPPIEWTTELHSKFADALVALGRLDTVSTLLPNTQLFLYMYVRKEAVLSSRIEGTQSSLSDLLLYEMHEKPGVPIQDVQEVSNYVAALQHGLRRLDDGLPLSLRLFREIHGVLLADGRVKHQAPGEFRRSQNWIGGTRPSNAAFVPPPANEVMTCMSDLERFLHDHPQSTPVLVKAALAHVQFETIHPFLDGNGRLGRLLITLLLYEQRVLREPILYLSLYFNLHRAHYYALLNEVRETGDWEAWLDFFADAVIVTANHAVATAQRITRLTNEDREKIRQIGRASASALQVHQALMASPITTSGRLVDKTGITPVTVNRALDHLEQLGIVKELTSKKRNRLFSYTNYVEILGAESTDVEGRDT